MFSYYKSLKRNLTNLGPVLLLYYLSISEIDTVFSNKFEILSFNLQIIIIYYWMLKSQNILGSGHVFFAGIINDVIMGLPIGSSALAYLVVSFVALYIRNITVNFSLFTDWFTFLIAIFFSNLVFILILHNFSEIRFTYLDIFYNAFFTFLFYPPFWFFFNIYREITSLKRIDD